LTVIYPQGIGLTGLEVHFYLVVAQRVAVPIVEQQAVIQPQPNAIVYAQVQHVAARGRGHQPAGPAHRKIFGLEAGHRAGPMPVKINDGIAAARHELIEIAAVVIVTL
jgi:hypothetical protein